MVVVQLNSILEQVLGLAKERLDFIGQKSYDAYTEGINERIDRGRKTINDIQKVNNEKKNFADETMSEIIRQRLNLDN